MAAKRLGIGSDLSWVREFIDAFDFTEAGEAEPAPLSSKQYYEIGCQLMNEGRQALEFCNATASSEIDKAILKYRNGLMIATIALVPSLRVGDLLAFAFGLKKLSTFHLGTGTTPHAFKIPKHIEKTKIEAKIGKLPTQLRAHYDYYFSDVRSKFKESGHSHAVWLTIYGEPLNYSGFYTMFVKVILDRAGVQSHPNHSRHAGADTARDKGMSVPKVLKHKNDRTQSNYGRDDAVNCGLVASKLKI